MKDIYFNGMKISEVVKTTASYTTQNSGTETALYWRWEKFLTPVQCDMILSDRKQLLEEDATMDGDVRDESYRKTKVAWLQSGHWLEGTMFNLGRIANNGAKWGFTIDTPEHVQLAKYDSNGFYHYHVDSVCDSRPLIRKISVVALLNDPSEYEGGEFITSPKDETIIKMGKGDIIAFPSVMMHKVSPVTKGERFSAVCWISGPK